MTESQDGDEIKFLAAVEYATRLHWYQERKGAGTPYIGHLLGVTGIVLDYGGSWDEAIAALLHDAVEDQPVSVTDLCARFGDQVAEIVVGCSDAETSKKPPWWERKERYIEHLADAPPSVLLVSAADKLHNARAILADLRVVGDALWERFKTGKEGTLWYYRALVDAYRRAGAPRPLVDELDLVVSEVERLAAS